MKFEEAIEIKDTFREEYRVHFDKKTFWFFFFREIVAIERKDRNGRLIGKLLNMSEEERERERETKESLKFRFQWRIKI